MRDDVQCGPRAAVAAGNVLKVADDKGMGVGGVALDADAIAAGIAIWVESGNVVNAHEDLVVDDLVETLRLGLIFGDIVYEPACRVANLCWNKLKAENTCERRTCSLKFEHVEPIASIVNVSKVVLLS